jgi:quercetin dioxygenase-like cupin family protein
MNEIIDLKNIEYSQADINKELVFDNQQSSLTLISLRQGTERKLHTDKEDEVIIVIEGNVIITIGDEEFELTENQMIVMPKLISHGLKALTDTKMLLLRPKHTH